MSNKLPKITALHPVVLADNRRVTLEMSVDNLPDAGSNIMLMPEIGGARPAGPPQTDPAAASPYPHVELSILNSRRQTVASLYIVEHKESHVALTLHLPQASPNEPYTARAEMTHNNQTIDVVETPFTLNPAG